MHCWTNKLYYVCCRLIANPKDGVRDFIEPKHLGRARYYAKKLKLKERQIDVWEKGKKKYVLQGSWL